MIFFNSSEIFFTLTTYSVFEIFFNPVIANETISSQIIFGKCMDSITFIFSNFIKAYHWIWTDSLDSVLTLLNFTKLNLGFVSSLYSNSWAFNLTNFTSYNLRLSTYSLQIYTCQLATEYFSVLNHNSVVSFRNHMHSSLFEIWKFRVWALEIRINWYNSCSLICFVSNKFTANQIYRSGWKTN